MGKLILHIGRHKTGTSSIQRWLSDNRGLLNQLGFHYPTSGILGYGHHRISELLLPRNLKTQSLQQACQDNVFVSLFDEVNKLKNNEIILLSSEGFQNVSPDILQRVFENYDIEVICYLRNQTDYFLSAYNQKVHATDYTGELEDYYKNVFSKVNYLSFVEQWQTVSYNLILRIYDRHLLENSDVICDFAKLLDIDDETFAISKNDGTDKNPTLPLKLLQFKLRLNKRTKYNKQLERRIYAALSILSNSYPKKSLGVTEHLKEKIVTDYHKDNILLFEKYFPNHKVFDLENVDVAAVESLTEEEFESIFDQVITIDPLLKDLKT